jgi:hypothetical protein
MRFSADGRRGVVWGATGLIYQTLEGAPGLYSGL